MAEIYALNIGEKIDEEKYKDLWGQVSQSRRSKLEKMYFDQDAKRGLYAILLFKYIICTKFKNENNQIHMSYNIYGKPYIKNKPGWHFNLSHSGEWVVCGWNNYEIGIDIEQVKHINLNIAKRFFTNLECIYLQNAEKDQKMESFYELWTLKESYIKYKGKGLSIPLNTFEFDLRFGSIILKSKDVVKPCFFMSNLMPNYKLALCSEEIGNVSVTIVPLNKIWDTLCK